MDYVIDGRPLRIPSGRLVLFWAGIPHQTTAIDYGANHDSRQCNALPLARRFLAHAQPVGSSPSTMMGGGVVMLPPETIGASVDALVPGCLQLGDAEAKNPQGRNRALMLRTRRR